MVVTVEQAVNMLPAALNLVTKLEAIIADNTAMSADEEIAALEAARMRPSSEVIAEADEASRLA